MPNPKQKNNKVPINSLVVDGDSAELTLYGDVVTDIPVDWWTGKPIEGLFIVLEEVLQNLKDLKDKANITIRINSYGGDVYAGLAIYNRLKELKGNKTVVVDGIAASAASIIAMAGNTIKIPPSATLMIHNPMMFMYGYYNQNELFEVDKVLEHLAIVSAETYVAKTGKTLEEVREIMSEEMWLTGRAAVEQGFADELIEDKKANVEMSADRKYLFVNGVRYDVSKFKNTPKDFPICTIPAVQEDLTTNTNGETNEGGTETVANTVEELRAEYPELVNQIETEAHKKGAVEGATNERTRLKDIEAIEGVVGDKTLIEQAKYGETPLNAAELAFQAMQQQAKLGAQHLESAAADNKASGAQEVGATPNGGVDPTTDPTEEEMVNMIVGNKGVKQND